MKYLTFEFDQLTHSIIEIECVNLRIISYTPLLVSSNQWRLGKLDILSFQICVFTNIVSKDGSINSTNFEE